MGGRAKSRKSKAHRFLRKEVKLKAIGMANRPQYQGRWWLFRGGDQSSNINKK